MINFCICFYGVCGLNCLIGGIFIDSCEFVFLVSAISCNIAIGKTPEEIALLSTFFTQIGDTLATLSAFDAFSSDNDCN